MIRPTFRQTKALGILFLALPEPPVLANLGNPNEPGPLLVDLDAIQLRVSESGICTLAGEARL